MSRNQAPDDTAPIRKAIDQVLLEMDTVTADSEEFKKMTDNLVTLTKALPHKDRWEVYKVVLPVAANLAGIIMILGFEKFNVVTSKALGFVMKAR